MRRLYLLSCLPLAVACNGSGSERGDGAGDGVVSASVGDADTSEDAGADGGGTADSGGLAPAKWDVGDPPEGNCAPGMGGNGPLSHIWIANSAQGTVSKVNTQSMTEEGRYVVRPDGAGSPSRTSVSLSANVAVANRNGGVTKIYANDGDCVESNGTPGIQTAIDGNFLPWGQDECVAWHTPLAYLSNRPMAWAQGEWNDTTCKYENEKLWTAGTVGPPGTTEVLLLDGDTGVVEQTIPIPEVVSSIGLYGGAVDGDGNFWGIESGQRLVRVDRQNFTYQIWTPPVATYGIAVDSKGRPWTCAGGGASRFDPVAQTWQTLASPGGNQWGGCMTDGQGTLWHCRHSDATLVGIDTETLQVVDQIPLPSYAHGISIDFDGNVWAVGFVSNVAYRVNPTTHLIDTFDQLVGAYSYSDMTGFALASVTPNG